MASPVPITFQPSGAVVWVAPGTTVLAAARSAGVVVNAPCAGRGICGACGVKVVDGELQEAAEQERAGLRRAPEGVRLACQARVQAAVTVRPIVVSGSTAVSGAVSVGDEPLVAGVDLGTTSVSAALIGQLTGREYGNATVGNSQVSFGGDVLSRVQAAIDGEGSALRRAATESVLSAIDAAVGGSMERVSRVVIAGNPAMSALLAGADVDTLAHHPFEAPDTGDELPVASELRRSLPKVESVALVPPLAGFVGGDALAGAIALGLMNAGETALLLDLGTNAEVVLSHRGRLIVASAAAGPAFEGGGVSCGGPAAPGAVTDVAVGGDSLTLTVLGGGPARWLSGAGLLRAVQVLREKGHLDREGLMHVEGPLARLMSRDAAGVMGVDLGPASGGCLRVTQLDVRSLQLAKAAVCAALRMTLDAAGVFAGGIEAVYVAGAFGSALRVETLVELGVVPEELASRTAVVGNASLMGASAIALDAGLLSSARVAAASVTHVDLAADPAFSAILMEATSLEPYRL